jgi:transposase
MIIDYTPSKTGKTMSKQNRRNFSTDFKAKIAIEAIKEQQTMTELAAKYEIHPNQITDWKKQFLSGASSVFETGQDKKQQKEEDTTVLYEQIGRLQMEVSYLKKKL